MSRAYNTNIRIVRKRFKKPRTPEETKFMSFFGATDLYNSYSQGFDRLSLQDPVMDLQASSNVPVPLALPMSLDELSLLSATDHQETHPSVQGSALPVMNKHVVPDLESGVNPDQSYHDTENNDVEILIGFLEEMGQKVHEVKALSAGLTKITLADLMGAQKVREPELVRVGGDRR